MLLFGICPILEKEVIEMAENKQMMDTAQEEQRRKQMIDEVADAILEENREAFLELAR